MGNALKKHPMYNPFNKGYFHSTTSMKSFRMGFFRVRQKSARGGLGFKFMTGLRTFAFLFPTTADGSATPAAARAVAQPLLIGLSPRPLGLIDGRHVDLRNDDCIDNRGLPPELNPSTVGNSRPPLLDCFRTYRFGNLESVVAGKLGAASSSCQYGEEAEFDIAIFVEEEKNGAGLVDGVLGEMGRLNDVWIASWAGEARRRYDERSAGSVV